jgi:dolichyl-diphosphooligosaccharide--protein glycosyltransferase
MTDAAEVRSLLDDRPDLESAVEVVMRADEPWEFDDVDIDSGELGELVSHGVVKQTDNGYRVADEAAVRAAVEGATPCGETGASPTGSVSVFPETDRVTVGVCLLVLVTVPLVRLASAPDVLRGGSVVLSGNDPYLYQYWVEQLLTADGEMLQRTVRVVSNREPLFVHTLRAAAVALGGTVEVSRWVAASYPVVAATLTGGAVFCTTLVVTEDIRVSAAAVLLFAFVPAHVFRTGLGFADHHAFDYFWLAVTTAAATISVAEAWRHQNRQWGRVALGVVGVTAGVSGQILAWEAGPLMLVPLGAVVTVAATVAVAGDRSPLTVGGPLSLGIVGGAVVTVVVHVTLGWHTTLVAVTPGILSVGCLTVVVVAAVTRRYGLPTATPLGVGGGVVAVGGLLTERLAPTEWERIVTSVGTRLFRTDAVAETGGLFGESFGWLLLFGFTLVLAAPFLFVGVRRATRDVTWLPSVVVAWYFLLLAAVQIRFAGQLAPAIAPFAGIGLVRLAAWVDVLDGPTETPTLQIGLPDRETAVSLVVLVLLVGSLSFVQVPVKNSQVTYSNQQYETASWIKDHSEARGSAYPDNYVLSQWGDSRFYNYHVSGESRSFTFAREQFSSFVVGVDGEQWYQRLREDVGYIVLTPGVVTNGSALGTRLYREHGDGSGTAAASSHYRLVYASDDEKYKVFELVPGARITGTTQPNESVTVSREISVDSVTFRYSQTVSTGSDGNYTLTVPYPGRFSVDGGEVTVPSSAVTSGATVSVDQRSQTDDEPEKR